MKKTLVFAAAAAAAGLMLASDVASARPFGGGFRMGGFHHGGFRPVGFHRGFHHGFRPVAFHRPFVFHRHRHHWRGWGWGAGAFTTAALVGAASYPYWGGYYPASYGWYGDCYQTLQWVRTPWGWRRAWVSTC